MLVRITAQPSGSERVEFARVVDCLANGDYDAQSVPATFVDAHLSEHRFLYAKASEVAIPMVP
jgi:hypothetical protein